MIMATEKCEYREKEHDIPGEGFVMYPCHCKDEKKTRECQNKGIYVPWGTGDGFCRIENEKKQEGK
jgi:hypothetical protein